MRRSRTWASSPRTRSTHTRPAMRAGVWLVCLVVVLACGREERSAAPLAAPVAPAPADELGRLDPAPYRAEIEATQALLYGARDFSEDDWKALSKALLHLHNQIVFNDTSVAARELSGRLFFFSARSDVATSARHSEAERMALRDQWQTLCAERFVPAAWIRTGTE